MTPRRDVDTEDRELIDTWFGKVFECLRTLEIEPKFDYLKPIETETDSSDVISRSQPFMAMLKVR